MNPVSAYASAPTASLARLLLAGSSQRTAVLAAHAENAERIDPTTGIQRRPADQNPASPLDADGQQRSGDQSPYGPAAIFEPSAHAQATVLGPNRKHAPHGEHPEREAGAIGKGELTEEERQQVEKMKARDQEVRRHEQAHKAAAGSHARGGPTYTYETGPDGKRYAVGGEVPIDLSPVEGNPQATIAKMQQIRRAALAPSDPSSQDRAVAAQAAQAEREARAELNKTGGEAESGRPNVPAKSPSHAGNGVQGYDYTPPGRQLDVTA